MHLGKVKLTTLTPRADGSQRDYFHTDGRGFGLRVSGSGARSWFLIYRSPVLRTKEGKPKHRRYTIGPVGDREVEWTYAAARKKVDELLARVGKGFDPLLDEHNEREERIREEALAREEAECRARGDGSFLELSRVYLERWAMARKRTWENDRRKIEKILIPAWGKLQAAEITADHVIKLLDDIVDRGSGKRKRGAPIQANRVLALVRKMYNFGLKRRMVTANPCKGIEAPSKENVRDRALSNDEIKVIWESLENHHENFRCILRLALLLGQRKGEVCGLRWAELDFNAGIWTIPAERAKNEQKHTVPLVGQALEILRNLNNQPHDPVLVFRSPRKRGVYTCNLQKPMRQLRKDHPEIPHFTVHDLRHTFATQMMMELGPSGYIVLKRLLNHALSKKDSTARYVNYGFDAEKRDAMLRWDSRLAAIVRGQKPSAEVVALPSVATVAMAS